MNTQERYTTLPVVDDLALAAGSTCPVLITAAPDEALDIARMIAVQSGLGERVDVLDFGEPGGSGSPGPTQSPSSSRVVLLREIHALTRAQQVWLMELLEKRPREAGTPRIMASSSVSLLKRVHHGRFDARLFYRLNALHLVVSDADES
jgi:hypothetical protein